MIGVLKVTDGNESVSFLANSTGVILQDWQPQTTQAKEGGIWAQSQFSDSRQMVMRSWANSIETFDVNIVGSDMDGSVRQFRKLQKLLTRAGDYWMSLYQVGSGAFVNPVWIEAQGDCESETRYAYIYDGTIPSLSNPHTEPFRNALSTTEIIQVIIEHGVWRDQKPGDSACMKTYSYVERNGASGNVFYPSQESDTVSADTGAFLITTNSLHQVATSPFGVDLIHAGIRFANITIPQGATITNAYIKLVSNYASGIGEIEGVASTAYGELSANAITYSDYADFTTRIDTVANDDYAVDWSAPTALGQTFYIYNVRSIVQEIINQGAWANGNAMAFKIYSPVSLNNLNRDYAAYNDPTYDMPELHIDYEISDVKYGIYIPACSQNYATGYSTNSQIEYLAIYDASSGIYGPNILNTFPSNLFPSPLGVGDRLLIGSSYPFTNIVFNLVSAGDGTVTYSYKYSTAGGIASGSFPNGSNYQFGLFDGIGNTGFTSIVLTRPSNWAKNSVFPVLPNLYWVVVEITGIAVAPAIIPAQTVQPVYTTAWPFWEVDSNEVGGDIPALLKFLLVQIQTLDSAGNAKGDYDHILIGTRRYSRGSLFTPYLNTQANADGVTFNVSAPATTPNNSLAPCGQSINLTTVGAAAEATIGTWTLTGSSLTRQYQGRYRVFVRSHLTTCGVNGLGLRVQFVDALGSPQTVLMQTDLVYNNAETLFDLVDLGYISLQNSGGLDHTRLDIVLRARATAAINIDILDIILFPVDETNIELYINGNGKFDYKTGADEPGYQPMHDSTRPKEGPYSAVVNTNEELIYTMSTKVLGQATISDHDRIRIFFLPYSDTLGELKGTESIFDGRFERVLQFRNMRGDE